MEKLQIFLLIVLCLVGSIFDIKKRIVPDTLNLLISMLFMLNFKVINMFGLIVPIIILIIAIKYGGIGGGDVKFILAISLILGFYKSIVVVILGLITMLIFYIILKMVKGKCVKSFPLIPFFSFWIIIINSGGIKWKF